MKNMMRVRVASSGWTGGPGLSTFYFVLTDGATVPNADNAQNASDRVKAALTAGLALYPTQWVAQVDPQVDILRDTDGELVEGYSTTLQTPSTGTGGIGFGPVVAALMLRYNTAGIVGGKRIRGRTFLSPIEPRSEANGSPIALALTQAGAIGDALLSAGATGIALHVWSRPRLASAGPPVVTARDGSAHIVTSIQVPDKFAALRSRRD